jgi:hypothetical protein
VKLYLVAHTTTKSEQTNLTKLYNHGTTVRFHTNHTATTPTTTHPYISIFFLHFPPLLSFVHSCRKQLCILLQ